MAFGRKTGLDALLHRTEQEGFWTRVPKSPTKTLATYLYTHRRTPKHNSTTPSQAPIHVVCISDTHNTAPTLPDGDILIHAGDLTQSGTRAELEAQIAWLDSQPHKYKIVIAGNHELCLDLRFAHLPTTAWSKGRSDVLDWKSLIYLEKSASTLRFEERNGKSRELKVFGSPYTPKHGNGAFQYPRSNTAIWDEIKIPEDTNILVTHGPPKAHLDLGHLGCDALRRTLWKMKRRPRLHVFGHVHGGYGREVVTWDSLQRAYEGVMDGNWRCVNLALLVWFWVLEWVTGGRDAWQQATVMVNAAAVGGIRDEKRREAIVVGI
ncbi:hypothetical protein BDV06DRAFT_205562 [Aspergillus oleicola]